MTPEKNQKRKVRAYLESIGAFFYYPVAKGYGLAMVDCIAGIRKPTWSVSGYRDFNGPATIWLLEIKAAEHLRPTPRQMTVLEDGQAKGCMAAWGTADKIIAEIKQWLND